MDIPVVSNQQTLVLLEMTKNYTCFLDTIQLTTFEIKSKTSFIMTDDFCLHVCFVFCISYLFSIAN